MKPIANTSCTTQLTDATLTAVSITIAETTPGSLKVKVGGLAAYKGDLTVAVATITDAAGFVAPAASVTISGSAQKTKIEGSPAVLEGDSGKATAVTFTHPTSGATTTHDVEVKISSAGQSKVKGE